MAYYSLNGSGEIDRMVLNNATGDAYRYGVLTHMESLGEGLYASYSYEYDVGGTSYSIPSTSTRYPVQAGPILVDGDPADPDRILSLTSVKADKISGGKLVSGSRQYRLADEVIVYERRDRDYFLSTPPPRCSDLSASVLIRTLARRFFLRRKQLRQSDAVQILVDHILQPLPQWEGGTVGGAAALALLRQALAVYRDQSPLRQAEDAAHGVLLWSAGQSVAAPLAPHPEQIAAAGQQLDDALQIFFRNSLTGRDLFQWDKSAIIMFRQINHHPQGIAAFR